MFIINQLLITIDNNTLNKYNKYYFALHPKRKKEPIESPHHPSINKWFIMKRPQMNGLKQAWKDFIMWLLEDYGFSNMNIESCAMTFTYYFKTKARHDNDNLSPKFILDGLAEGNFIIDDDYKHLHTLTIKCGWDKEHPRTEILVEY